MREDKEYLSEAAKVVVEELSANQLVIAVPMDQDVAEYMGAFEETAISADDLVDDVQLTINEQGEVIYG